MATQTLKIVVGNTAPPLQLTAQRNGVNIDLTGVMKVELIITRSAAVQNAGHQTCTVVTPTLGLVSYLLKATDTVLGAGTYVCDMRVTYGDATVEILYDQLKLKARNKAVSTE